MNKIVDIVNLRLFLNSVALLCFSTLLTWGATVYAVAEYIGKTGSSVNDHGGYTNIAYTTIDATVIVFAIGLFLIAGLLTGFVAIFAKTIKQTPYLQVFWGLLIVLGVVVAKILA
ncbi:hypothetical protein [Agarivorans sp. DSG3-1]|uniref:hypothetical protein n=1 Tax=Agarivorans sp. DSG3-1 TaxID=3342249 RepID=UPI00398F6CF4